MRRHAKASSAGSNEGAGSSRGLFRRALVTRGAPSDAAGAGAPAGRPAKTLRSLVTIVALTICAAAIAAAPASAAGTAPEAKMGAVSNVSYASAHVAGLIRGNSFATSWSFQYSTDDENWIGGPGGFFLGATDEQLASDLTGLKGGTKYFVRLSATNFADPIAISPGPNPSFTTLPVDPPKALSVDNAAAVNYTTAKVSGEVERPANPDPAFDVNCQFQIVTDQQFGENGFQGASETPCVTADSGETPGTVEAPGKSKVSADLSGLAGGTTYHLRLFTANASPTTDAKEAASTFTTKTIPKPSVITIDNASTVAYTTVHVSGEVQRPGGADTDPGLDATCNFEYIADEAFNNNPPTERFNGAGQVGCEPEGTIHAEGTSDVSANLTGLTHNTTYHLRLSAANAGGTDSKDAAATFTTKTITKPSVITIDNASALEQTSAHLSGKVQRPGGTDTDPALDANCNFEYITDKAFNENPSGEEFNGAAQVGCEPENPLHAEGTSDVSANLAGLVPATTYHLRLSASNAAGTDAKEAASTFTTKTVPKPSVLRIDNASDVTYSLAKVTGKVERPTGADPILDTNCTFEYLSEAAFGPATEVVKMTVYAIGGTFILNFQGQESAPIAFNASAATVDAALEGFTGIGAGNVSVSGGPGGENGGTPYVITFGGALANKGVPPLDRNVSGLIGSGGTPAVEISTTTQGHAEGFEDAQQRACEGEAPIHAEGGKEVEAHIGGLTPATKYHLRLTASNQGGADSKEAATFTTLGPVATPLVSIDPITTFSDTTAEFAGTVNPNGNDPAFNTSWHFVCTPSCGEPGGRLDADVAEHPVSLVASGLEPNTIYQVKLLASNAGGKSESTSKSFKTAPSPASVQTGYASEVQASSATIAGQVNPRNSAVTYQFEWGLSQSYGNLAPAAPADLGEVDNFLHPVSEPISGLVAATVYHFRLVATNPDTGTTTRGVDHTFETPGAAACKNQQLRVENGSTALPDCRAYELVSPIRKSGNDAGSHGGLTYYSHATAAGDRLLYGVGGAVEGASRGLQNAAVARREADRNRWSSVMAPPPGTQDRIDLLARRSSNLMPSADLTKIAWKGYGPWVADLPYPTIPVAPPIRGYYLGDLETGAVNWLSRPEVPFSKKEIEEGSAGFANKNSYFASVGAAPDLSTIYFQTTSLLFANEEARYKAGLGMDKAHPEEIIPGREVFEYSGGVVKPAGTLPDGKRPAGGSAAPNTSELGGGDVMRNQVSRDGSTLFFLSPDPRIAAGVAELPQLYVRRNGHSTLVSHTAADKAAPTGVVPVETEFDAHGDNSFNSSKITQYLYASPDGNLAIFQSRDVLAPGAPNDSTIKVYRYDVATDTVSFLPGLGGDPIRGNEADLNDFRNRVATVLASSDDGQRFLFNGPYVGVWDHGAISVVAKAGHFLSPARATSDGSRFVFQAIGIPGFNAPSGSNTAAAVYRYDLASDQLTCLSCPPEGVTPTRASLVNDLGDDTGGSAPNFIISEDADRVFFETDAPLVSGDTNGVSDVYEWTPSGPHLISSGKSPEGSYVLSNSASGNDAFFTTAEGIDPRDTDGLYDVYDARVGGGFPQKDAVTPCTGNDICHEAPAQPPTQPGAGTPGNKHSDTPKFSVGLGKVVGGSLRLQIKAPEAATVAASGRGLRTTRGNYSKPGSYKLAVPLKPSAKGALRKGRTLKLEVHLRFSPQSGALSSADLQLTVKG